jgi:hypothetical protein
VKADAQTLEALFGREVTYIVPVYQRPYVWNEEDQWGPLWRDLLEVVKARQKRAAGESQHVPEHFLGAIVLAQRDFSAGSIELREIIDGQQRLATIQILISAASRVVAEFGFAGQAQMLDKWIANSDFVAGGDPERRLKVWPSRSDRAAFLAAVQGTEATGALADHRITQANQFFTEVVRGWVDGLTKSTAMRRSSRTSMHWSRRSAACSGSSSSTSTKKTSRRSSSRLLTPEAHPF